MFGVLYRVRHDLVTEPPPPAWRFPEMWLFWLKVLFLFFLWTMLSSCNFWMQSLLYFLSFPTLGPMLVVLVTHICSLLSSLIFSSFSSLRWCQTSPSFLGIHIHQRPAVSLVFLIHLWVNRFWSSVCFLMSTSSILISFCNFFPFWLFFFLFFFKFYFIFKLYITVLVFPNIKMNPPQV